MRLKTSPEKLVLSGMILVVILAIATICAYLFPKPQPHFTAVTGEACNVAVVPLVGELFASEAYAQAKTATDHSANASAEYVIRELRRAQADASIRGVILQIDSNGGVGGDLIALALQRLKKPSVALVVNEGASSAYEAATGATAVIVSRFSDVGDIGVTASYVETANADAADGKRFIQLSAGRFKDMGNPDKPITPEGQARLQREVDEEYKEFVAEVAHNRHLPVATVQALADGSSYAGPEAVTNHLADLVGDSETARLWFEKRFNGGGDAVVLCE